MLDTVLMDLDTYSKREIELDARQAQLDEAEKVYKAKMRFLNGDRGIPIEQLRSNALAAIQRAADEQKEIG